MEKKKQTGEVEVKIDPETTGPVAVAMEPMAPEESKAKVGKLNVAVKIDAAEIKTIIRPLLDIIGDLVEDKRIPRTIRQQYLDRYVRLNIKL